MVEWNEKDQRHRHEELHAKKTDKNNSIKKELENRLRKFGHDRNKPGERFLADFELFEEMRQQMAECFVADTALYNIEVVVCFLHDPQPRLVNSLEPLRLLHQHRQVIL